MVVDVERVGVCGTDVEFFTGEMAYLHQRHARFPIRLGHEWAGSVAAVGDGVDRAWLGRRVMGDTMLGDGVCRRCRRGHQHVCEHREEVGIRGGRDGALAEQVAVPATSLHALPAGVDPVLGALVEPGGSALRASRAADLRPGDRMLVAGPGTIDLLVAMFTRAAGAEVHLLGLTQRSLAFARSLGLRRTWTADTLPDVAFDAVVDASNGLRLRPGRPPASGGRDRRARPGGGRAGRLAPRAGRARPEDPRRPTDPLRCRGADQQAGARWPCSCADVPAPPRPRSRPAVRRRASIRTQGLDVPGRTDRINACPALPRVEDLDDIVRT